MELRSVIRFLTRTRSKSASTRQPGRKRLQRKQQITNADAEQQSDTKVAGEICLNIDPVPIDNNATKADLDSTYVQIVFKSEDELTFVNEDKPSTANSSVKVLVHRESIVSDDSASFYSIDEMEYTSTKRTRAKTPVYMIGQLERISEQHLGDKTLALAEEYQATLPPRNFTPHPPTRAPGKLRKIKCQVSLRSLNKAQSQIFESPGTDYSEGETLVNWDSDSPIADSFEESELILSDISGDLRPLSVMLFDSMLEGGHDIGMQICTDLLSKELASALTNQTPIEASQSASELQILLMIEAYEKVQNQLQETRITSQGHVSAFEQVLNHWLEVLYNIYDESQERIMHEEIMNRDNAHEASLPYASLTAEVVT